MTSRLLIIALDGADGGLLDRLSADGSLPHLAALRARGRAKRLTGPPGATDDALWASFQYGSDLGEHGRYSYWLQLEDGHFGWSHLREADWDTFWDGLAGRGQRVAVIDVPKCRAPKPINGIHLTDWLAHGRYFPEPLSHPPSLANEIVDRFGPAPASRCAYDNPPVTDDDARDIVGHLRASIAQKRAAGMHYMQAEPWDLFIIGFKEMHCWGHGLWDLIDPGHPAHDPVRARQLGDPALSVLRDIDEAVGELVVAAGPEAAVVVFSTTDMTPNGSAGHLVPAIVVRLNKHLAGKGEVPSEPVPGWGCRMLSYSDNTGALRIGQRDAEPGPEAKVRVIDEVQSLIGEMTDAETGAEIASSFNRPSAEFSGAYATSLPDLLIHFRSGAFPREIVSPRLGRIRAESRRLRPGNHLPGGFLIAAGDAAVAVDDVSTMADFADLATRVLI